eukprot:scaffold195475_cov39-Cyclotella_meneghiniana.AAC.1
MWSDREQVVGIVGGAQYLLCHRISGAEIVERLMAPAINMRGCYTLEGDSPLILTGLSVFRRIESQIESNFGTPGLKKAVDKAAVTMLDALEKEWVEKCSAAQILVNEINPMVAAAKANVDSLAQEKAAVTSNSSSRSGRVAKRTSKATDTNALEEVMDQLVNAKFSLREAKDKEKDLTNKLKEIQKSFEEWCWRNAMGICLVCMKA